MGHPYTAYLKVVRHKFIMFQRRRQLLSPRMVGALHGRPALGDRFLLRKILHIQSNAEQWRVQITTIGGAAEAVWLGLREDSTLPRLI